MSNRTVISILGVDTQLLDDQSPDGLCRELINLKPRGRQDKPFWSPFEKIDTLKNVSSTPFAYTHGIANIKNVFWQIRNRVNDKFKSTSSTSLERLLVLCEKAGRCAIDIIDPTSWSIVKTLDLPEDTGYDFTATRIKEITVINLTLDDKPFAIYYLIDDLFLEQGWPELPKISFSQAQQVFTESEVISGTAYGVDRGSTQYYMVRYAFKLYDGSYVKHSTPILIKVDSSATTYAYMVPTFTLEGYAESLVNKDFWETQIAGVSCFASLPKTTIKEATNEGNFYELSFFPSIDKILAGDWPTSQDENVNTPQISVENWPNQRLLNIDGFTHHKVASRVVDSYNQRLLLGGKSTNFALPKSGVRGNSQSEVLDDFLDISSQSYTELYEYYDSLGNLTSEGSHDYYTYQQIGQILFAPKAGREIMSSTIISSTSPFFTESAPHGETLPNRTYTLNHATYGGANLLTKIEMNESPSYGGSMIPSMEIEIEIGPTGGSVEDTIRFTVTLGSSGSPLFISGFENVGSAAGDYNVYHQVKIVTDNGEYYRTLTEVVSNETSTFYMPTLLSYPDRRAVSYKMVIKNGSDYEVIFDKKLIQHPSANYSYTILDESVDEYSYVLASGSTTTEPDNSGNSVNHYNANEVQPSETNQPFTFDVATVYRIGNRENDVVQGFAVNTLDISQGQFGQYPLYVLTDKSIWALEQSSDPSVTFASIVPVDTEVGVISPHAISIAKTPNDDTIIIAIDKTQIYSIIGRKTERLDWPISFDNDYKTFIANARVAYHVATDYQELVFSNPAFSYSWYYNLRFGTWYKGTESFKLFIQKQPTIQAINTSNVLKDFGTKITNENVSWSINTRPFNFNDPYSLKKLKASIARMSLTQENEEDPNNYQPLAIKLFGNRDNHSANFKLMDKFYKKETTKDPWVSTKFGPFQTFEIEMSGQSMCVNSKIYAFECEYEVRYLTRVRR